MPRRRKTKEEKERIIEKPSLSQEEINSLEQMLEKDEEKIDFSELRGFLDEPRTQKSSPSLSKINAPQRIPTRLETNLAEDSTSNNNSKGEEDPFKYNAREKKSEESKYVKYEGMIIENIIPHGEIQKIGKEKPFERREIRFENSPQARIAIQENFEKYFPVSKIDKDKIGKEKPFERREIKYTPEKY